jgi:hypothetical protein
MERHHPGGGWVDIVRQSIAVTYHIPDSVRLTITYIDKDDKETPLYVVLLFQKSPSHILSIGVNLVLLHLCHSLMVTVIFSQIVCATEAITVGTSQFAQ